jgi:hypothetical protein
MGIQQTIERNLTDTAVYWEMLTNDGYGGHIFALPREVKCRWEDRNETFVTSTGDIAISKSIIYLKEDLKQESYLFKGTLDDIYDSLESSAANINPKEIANSNIIRRFDKLPALHSITDFLRKVYVTSKNMV